MKKDLNAKVNFRFARIIALASCVFLVVPAVAQQSSQSEKAARPPQAVVPARPHSVTDLAELNLGRVAATALQIQTQLRREPALFLEVKRWIALEASNRGQIIEDADLTEAAIFKRLEEDVELRAASTQILQRYGFLLPQINPTSELAKERELVRQEKAKHIARIELEQENRLFQPPTPETTRARELDDYDDDDRPRRGRRSRASAPRDEQMQGSRPENDPAMRSPLPDTRIGNRDSLLTQASGSSAFLPGSGGGLAAMAGMAGGVDRAAMLAQLSPDAVSRLADLQAGSATQELDSTMGNASRRERAARHKRYDGLDRGRLDEREEAPDSSELRFRANPYAAIPSLYDLYQQAAPRPAKIERFGTEAFRNAEELFDSIPMDLPGGPDYVVGPGDGLAIDIWGGISQRVQRTVDREGRINLPETGPVLVSGRTLGEVQRTVQQVLRTQFRDVSADVSLQRHRTIRVYVVGDVLNPGPYEISSLSTPLSALFEAGGPSEKGSFRILRHMRGSQLVQEVDAYDLLLRGVRGDLRRLENGDSVLVPPLMRTVRVEGMVRRPAIYELRNEKNLAEVLELAGGILPTATLRNIQVQRLEANEKKTMLSVSMDPNASREQAEKAIRGFAIGDNDEVKIFPIAQHNQEIVYLDGHVLRPGKYSYRQGMKATEVVTSFGDLLPEPATKYAEIIRLNPPDYRPSVESFDLAAALADPSKAPSLQPMDTIRVFSRFDFEEPPAVWVGGEVSRPGAYLTSGIVRLRDAVHLAGGATPDASMANAQVFRTMPDSTLKIFSVSLGGALAGNPADNIALASRDRILIHRNLAKVDPATVYIKGEVSKPGRYPLTTNMRMADLIRVAGGLKRSADTQTADLTRFILESGLPQSEQRAVNLAAALSGDGQNDTLLHDGDTIAIRQLAGWQDIAAAITVRGEVNAPGTFGIRPGERLSSILKRAGGYGSAAYAAGATLERVSVRDFQERSRDELILRIQSEMERIQVSLKEAPHEQVPLQKATEEQLRRALYQLKETPVRGNLVVRLHPKLEKLEGSPDDIEVRAGDVLTIPKQPSHVTISGQVYNPNAIAYRGGKSVDWYLEKAGGPTDLANKSDIFVVRASGAVVSGKSGWWRGFADESILPGDVIVVPEKPVISSFWSRNGAIIAQILSSAAVTVALSLR